MKCLGCDRESLLDSCHSVQTAQKHFRWGHKGGRVPLTTKSSVSSASNSAGAPSLSPLNSRSPPESRSMSITPQSLLKLKKHCSRTKNNLQQKHRQQSIVLCVCLTGRRAFFLRRRKFPTHPSTPPTFGRARGVIPEIDLEPPTEKIHIIST